MQRSCLKHYHTIILIICICECIRFIGNSARQLVCAFSTFRNPFLFIYSYVNRFETISFTEKLFYIKIFKNLKLRFGENQSNEFLNFQRLLFTIKSQKRHKQQV